MNVVGDVVVFPISEYSSRNARGLAVDIVGVFVESGLVEKGCEDGLDVVNSVSESLIEIVDESGIKESDCVYLEVPPRNLTGKLAELVPLVYGG